METISHVIVLSVLWYIMSHFINSYFCNLFHIKIREQTKTAIEFVAALALLGLQKNLMDKLEYLTFTHPFRMVDLYD